RCWSMFLFNHPVHSALYPLTLHDALPISTIERCEAANAELNLLVTQCYLQALAAARGPLSDGPFTGVPMLVKDLTETAGVRTTFSSRASADYVPEVAAAVARRMTPASPLR